MIIQRKKLEAVENISLFLLPLSTLTHSEALLFAHTAEMYRERVRELFQSNDKDWKDYEKGLIFVAKWAKMQCTYTVHKTYYKLVCAFKAKVGNIACVGFVWDVSGAIITTPPKPKNLWFNIN